MSTEKCNHDSIRCINHFDLIRKYQCLGCNAVMMCECDRATGEMFLSHQLHKATDSESKLSVPVTIGFQPKICNECRGLCQEAHPRASTYGSTSKIKRYYWRELFFREMVLFTDWARDNESDLLDDRPEAKAVREKCAEQALEDIKAFHTKSPKYSFSEESQTEFLARCPVGVIDLYHLYLPPENGRRCLIVDGGQSFPPEAIVQRHFSRMGYDSLAVESVPFHVLFGIFTWSLIEDGDDPLLSVNLFGDRFAFEEKQKEIPFVKVLLPHDFGTSAYFKRRSKAVASHFNKTIGNEDLEWLFEFWLPYSDRLRQYLWAHREEHVLIAKQLLKILPREATVRVLKYLIEDYWVRYIGWPDLLVFNEEEFFFVEVKASGDKLSGEQRTWIEGNLKSLHFPFKLVKIHKAGVSG
ncbi:MAG: hypothetical protein DWH81_12470 [Planctomycetota bacterium]|nr:MAG: hypothetical protein DWH81_12470 [Planctomycetota bacterium]